MYSRRSFFADLLGGTIAAIVARFDWSQGITVSSIPATQSTPTVASFSYDASVAAPTSSVTTYVYDAQGRLVSVTSGPDLNSRTSFYYHLGPSDGDDDSIEDD